MPDPIQQMMPDSKPNTSYEMLCAWLKKIDAKVIWEHGNHVFRIIGFVAWSEQTRRFFVVTLECTVTGRGTEVRNWDVLVPAADGEVAFDILKCAAKRLKVERPTL